MSVGNLFGLLSRPRSGQIYVVGGYLQPTCTRPTECLAQDVPHALGYAAVGVQAARRASPKFVLSDRALVQKDVGIQKLHCKS